MGYELTAGGVLQVEPDVKPKVLVVEDDPHELRRVSHVLRQNGFFVIPTGSLDQVAETAAQEKADVVLLEKGVTFKRGGAYYGGANLCSDIADRTTQAGLDTRVVLFTLLLAPGDFGDYGSVGLYDTIPKPTTDAHLVSTLRDIVSRDVGSISYKKKVGRVLVVDDYADMTDLISDALKQIGFNSYSASNVPDGLDILNNERDNIDIVVSDWGVAHRDLLIDRAGALGKQVVVMSGYPEQYVLKQYASEVDFLSKIDAYFKKPFDISSFAKTVQSLAEPHSPLRMPDVRARYDGEVGKRILLTGQSTSGKSTVAGIVCRRIPSAYMPNRLTSRVLREGEVDGQGLLHVSEGELAMCESLEGMHAYRDGGNGYTADTEEPVSADQIIPSCAIGFREMASLYPNDLTVYLGISLETMAERLKDRPGSESARFARARECLKIFSGYFPVSGDNRVFNEVIRTDNTQGSRIANTLYSARRLARYIAAQRN